MTCRFCAAVNSDVDHRCVRCGRRLERAPIATRLSPIPVPEVEAEYVPSNPHPAANPVQASLFPGSGGGGTSLRVVPPRARRDVPRPTPVARSFRGRGEGQQNFDFSSAQAPPAGDERSIYCEAPVALPMHRVLAAAFDASMVLISFGLFLIIFYLAGAQVVLNKATIPLYGIAAFATLVLYRLLWCAADCDSIGMRWAGLELLNFDGAPPDRNQRLHRLITSNISMAAGGLGLIWALVDEEKLTWHDHMSKTFPTPARPLSRLPQRLDYSKLRRS